MTPQQMLKSGDVAGLQIAPASTNLNLWLVQYHARVLVALKLSSILSALIGLPSR